MDIAAGHLILKEAGGEHIKILDDGSWGPYIPGDDDESIKGIIAIGDHKAVRRIMESVIQLKKLKKNWKPNFDRLKRWNRSAL